MGSQEGFGSGSGGVVVGEIRWRSTSVGRKDDIIAANVSVPSYWNKVPDPERCSRISQPSNLHSDNVSNGRNFGSLNSHPPSLEVDVKFPARRSCKLERKPPTLEVDVKFPTRKSGKLERKNSGYTKGSGITQMETPKSKLGVHDVNGISPEFVSSSVSCNTTVSFLSGTDYSSAPNFLAEKNQIIKQNNSSSSRRGDKRISRVKHKSRCDSFSLKNGLVGFNSATGGNNFLGMYGLKPDVFDITKFVNELPLHDLISGNYTSPCIAKDKGKKSASSNSDLMQSVRKACSVIQAQKGLQAQTSAEIHNSYIRSDSTGLITVNSAVGQIDVDKCTPLRLSPGKVHESADKIRKSSIADSPLYTLKYIFEHLTLPLPKDLDLLLSDASKTTSKNCTDPRVGKQAPQRTGLPPFPWSQSLSGNTKLGSDAVKLSASRTTCQGRWVKVQNPIALQKSSADLLANFESLAFDQSLVPSNNLLFEKKEKIFEPTECAVSTSGTCSSSKVSADECPLIHAAAQTLLDIAAYSKENPSVVVKLLKKPSQMTMKASKSKAIKRCDLLDVPDSKIRPASALKPCEGFSSKKLKLSKDVPNASLSHTELTSQRKYQSPALPVRSPPSKLIRDSNASTSSYGTNLVKKPCVIKTQRGIDRPSCPSSSKSKFWKPSL